MNRGRQPPVTSRHLVRIVIYAAALAVLAGGYALAMWQIHGYEAHLTRQQVLISGTVPTPVLRLTPTTPTGDIIAVIVHGYAGSKEVMVGFGIALARSGLPSYLLDLPGHGASEVAFNPTLSDNRSPQSEQALDEVVTYAREHSRVAQPRIILIGHSLGTAVVGEYALHHPASAIAATILVSPVLADLPTSTQPANLLLLYGEYDIAGIIPLAQHLFAAGCIGQQVSFSHTAANNFQACATPGDGFARRLVVIPGANHLTILLDAHTFLQIQHFLEDVLRIPPPPAPSTEDGRNAWALLGVLCAFGAAFPLSALLATALPLAASGPTTGADAPTLWSKLGLVAGSVAITVVVLRLWSLIADSLGTAGIRTPFTWVHLALADNLTAFGAVLALVLFALHRLLHRPLPWPAGERWGWQLALAGAVGMALYLTIGTLAAAGWEHFFLNGPRGWRFILIALAHLPLFALLVGMFGDEQGWWGLTALLGAYTLICLGAVAAILLDHSLLFLLLLLPIQALLFGAFALLGCWLGRQSQALGLASAALMASIFAWALAAVFPLLP